MKPRRTWDELNVIFHPEVRTAIDSLNYPTMTPVQAAAIPLLLTNKDVAAEAVTGNPTPLLVVPFNAFIICRFGENISVSDTNRPNVEKAFRKGTMAKARSRCHCVVADARAGSADQRRSGRPFKARQWFEATVARWWE